MKINIEAIRKLTRLISNLPENLIESLLDPLNLPDEILPDSLVGILDEARNGEWSLSDYKILWSVGELGHFFNLWVSPHKVAVQQINLRQLRKQLKSAEITNDQLITLELSFDPLLFFIARTPTSYRSLLDKTLTTDDIRDACYWAPEMGLVLTAIHTDSEGKTFLNLLKTHLFGTLEDFRIKSLNITKLFNTDRWINQLVVSADPQISGFDGLVDIRFTGPDVKKGLAGLYRRHDIRVYIHQIGPNIAIENENIRLKVGNKLKIKSIEGLFELHMLIFDDLYPSDAQLKEIHHQFEGISEKEDEIMTIKREHYDDLESVQGQINDLNKQIEELKRIKLSELASRWEKDQLRVEYRLTKEIANGVLRAKFVEDALVKI